MRRLSLFALLPLLPLLPLTSLSAQSFDLSVRNVMRGPELVGEAPGNFQWTPDSRWLWFRWNQPGVDTAQETYRLDPRSGPPVRMAGVNLDTIVAGNAVWSHNGRRALYSVNGDIVLWDGRATRYLTRGPGRESSPSWSADGRTVFFQRDGQVWSLGLETAELRQLTDIRSGNAPREEATATGQRAYLERQQDELFDFISSGRYRNQPWNRARAADTTPPVPFFPGEGKNVGSMQVTPDGGFVLMTIAEPARNQQRITMPLWITDDGYLGTFTGRNLVGDDQGSSRAAVLEVASGKVTFVGDSVGTGDRSITGVDVSSNSRYALLRITGANREDLWYAAVDLPALTVREIDHEHDAAWLGSPGPGLFATAGFMPDGETVYFGSERTGYIHLYQVPATGGEAVAYTSGAWEVDYARLSPDGRTWHIGANREGPHDYHFYTMPAGGGALTRVTDQRGRQDVTPSPDGRWLAVRHSTANDPPELYLREFRAGQTMRPITESTTEEFRRGPWIVPEIVWITASDGVRVPARLYRPTPDTVPAGRRPAVIFVHGAGYTQNVHNWWASYYREYMFHHVLASRGYTVLDMDYRASEGYGRDWRTAIYRYMGGRDLDDNVDGARWLMREMGVDSTRMGVYGGSYGGFITLMALFTKPGMFAAGAALRPVTDWAHYNHGYTAAILNEPQTDSVAYRQSSPIYFADGLQDQLLMAHGMVDDNVLFYDTARLTQRLIELGKTGWETAIYPVERHSFTEVASWQDEYRRIFELFERVLKR